MTVTVTIGLNSNRTLQPLPVEVASSFTADIRNLFSTVYVDGATSIGQWQDVATGATVTEQSLTWVGEAPPSVTAVLADIARTYEQDAIACTVGETSLIG